MPSAEIIESAAPYYRIRVLFGLNDFEQLVVSPRTGAALDSQLQDYADDMATQFQQGLGGGAPAQ